MNLTDTQKTDVAFAIATDLENAVLNLKKLCCDGSFLKGYTVTKRVLTPEEVGPYLIEVVRATCQVAGCAGIDPIALTDSVHAGSDVVGREPK